jgi:non-specific serine/threonine protein kinase
MTVYVEKGPSRMIPTSTESLYVYTKSYKPSFTEIIRLFPIRYYDPADKKWELPLSAISLVRKNFSELVYVGKVELDSQRFKTIDEYLSYLETLTLPPGINFDFKTKPDPHQLEWFIKMLDRHRVILGDPPGLGKTKEYLDVIEYRKLTKGYGKVLFICKSKHKGNMGREIEIHTNSKYLLVEGTENKRIEQLREFYRSDDLTYLIMGYESAAHHSKHLKTLAKKMGFDAVLMDEFTKIKNWGSNRKRKDNKPHITIQITKMVEVVNPELLIMGSGTPMPKDPTDLYAPLRLTGIERREHQDFRRRYCLVDSWGRTIGHKNKEELTDTLREVMIRRPEGILKLEEPRITFMPITMTPDQSDLYQAARKGIKEKLRGTKIHGASRFALLTRLRQITTNPALVDSKVKGIKEHVLQELLEETVEEAGQKAVIYSIYRQETLLLRELLKKYSPAYIDGYSRKPMEEVDKLQNDEDTRILIGSLLATSESFTLTRANFIYFLDLSWTWTDNIQAIHRLQRRGQKKLVNAVILYCRDTIDERVIDILERDAALIEEVIGGAESMGVSKEVEEYLLS